MEMYPECFNGTVGCFDDYTYDITLDPEVSPVVHAPRKVPIELKDKLQAELCEMESQDIIAKVTQPTDWVNSLVIREKENGRLRLCLDPKDLNKAIKREHHPIPTLEEITPKLAGAKLFSKLDARNGYWNVKLDEESSYLTTLQMTSQSMERTTRSMTYTYTKPWNVPERLASSSMTISASSKQRSAISLVCFIHQSVSSPAQIKSEP